MDHSTLVQCHTLHTGLLSRNLKPRQSILRAFFDLPQKLAPLKIICHMVFDMAVLLLYM
jgi:hypothetical protein